jgi:hypothetical protein
MLTDLDHRYYDNARSDREIFQRATAVTLTIAVTGVAIAGAMYYFDEPRMPPR